MASFNLLRIQGKLQRDTAVTMEGIAINLSASSGWAQNGQKYTQKGSGSGLTILVKMAAGNVVLTH